MKHCKFNKECPISVGFEIYFTGEDEEKWARRYLLSLIRKIFKIGDSFIKSMEDIKMENIKEGDLLDRKDILNEKK